MIVYHMSDSLRPRDTLASDFKERAELAEPFVQALEHGRDYRTEFPEVCSCLQLSAALAKAVADLTHYLPTTG